MKYNVTVKRVEQREHKFQVDANSPEEAEDKALELACDHDFGQNSVSFADEEVVSVEGVGTTQLTHALAKIEELQKIAASKGE